MTEPRKRRPTPLGDVVASFLEQKGLAGRVEQASIIPEWPELVGPQIAAVTEPRSIAADGTLFVAVKTSAWMNELSLLEPELLTRINRRLPQHRVRKIRWQLMR